MNLFYPPPTSETQLWCTYGYHWVEPDGRQWHRKRCPDCGIAYHREYDALNPQVRQTAAANYRNADPERYRRMKSDSKKRHPDTQLRNLRAYRARKANAICKHGAGCFDAAARLMPKVCTYCGSTERIEADHIVALSRGGLDCRENLQPLCRDCNSRKGSNERADRQRKG